MPIFYCDEIPPESQVKLFGFIAEPGFYNLD